MKTLFEKITLGILVVSILAFTKAGTDIFVEKLFVPESKNIVAFESEIEVPVLDIEIKDHNSFLNAIGEKESSNRYTVVNRFGYMGKYQFSKNTLKLLDIKVTKNEFLNNPGLQEEAMDRLLTENYKSLKRFIKKYENTMLHEVYITKSGVLAAAHLGGVGNVKKWFRKGIDFKDGNGTSIITYMNKFRGYELNI